MTSIATTPQSHRGSFSQVPTPTTNTHYYNSQEATSTPSTSTNMHVMSPSIMGNAPVMSAPPLSYYPNQEGAPGKFHPSPSLSGNGSSHNRKSIATGGQFPNRRSTMRPENKAMSSRAVLVNTSQSRTSYLSPQPQRTKRMSLVGFDPLAPLSAQPMKSSSAHSRSISSPPVAGLSLSPPPPPFVQAPIGQSLTPPVHSSSSNAHQHHRRGMQTFCVSELRTISSDAAEQEGLALKDTISSSSSSSDDEKRLSPTPQSGAASAQMTPTTTEKKAPRLSLGFGKTSPKGGKAGQKKESSKSSPKKGEKDGSRKSSTPPKSRILPWSKKGHRRTKSLESSEAVKNAVAKTEDKGTPSAPPRHSSAAVADPASAGAAAGDKKSSMYPSIVSDLMDLKFNNLQMPSLAKPSPTSFLTGNENEVVRTCNQEPAPHQVDIPPLSEFVVAARLIEFVENYRRIDQNFDLQQWVGLDRMDLRQIKIQQHIPIAQSLLDCGDDVCLQGAVAKGTNADDRLEAVVFEGQRQFIAVFRGTTEQQSKASKIKKSVPLDKQHESVEVYQCFWEEYSKLEAECFAMLDRITEEHPFCDVVFTGHSFGAAMATLAAFRYTNSRPMMRANCLTLGSPKVGFSLFRHMVNSLPNLKVMRLELGQDAKCQLPSVGGSHVGHTLVLKGSLGHNTSQKPNHAVQAYKFDTPKHKKFKTTHPDLRSYVNALEEISRQKLPWVKEFVGTSGQGVVVNNEARLVV